MSSESIIKGRILIDSDTESISGATIFIRLEDASFVDAPSKLVSEQIIKNVNYDVKSRNKLEFELSAENLDHKADYIIQVHIDVDGNGIVSSGDFINVESYPVNTHGLNTHGFTRDLSIRVKKLR